MRQRFRCTGCDLYFEGKVTPLGEVKADDRSTGTGPVLDALCIRCAEKGTA